MSTHKLVLMNNKVFPEAWRCSECGDTFALYRGNKISSLRHDPSGRYFLIGASGEVIGPSALPCEGKKPDD